MNPKLLDPDAWKAAAKRFNLADNGLLKALTTLDGLKADQHAERIKILKAINDCAQKMKKSPEVVASRDATKYVLSIIAETEAEARDEAAEAKLAAEKPPDLSALKSAAKAIAALPDFGKLWKAVTNPCWDIEAKAGTAVGVAVGSAGVLLSALAAEGPTAGASSLAVAGAIAALLAALGVAIAELVNLIKCYESHPEIPPERLKRAKDLLDALRKAQKLSEEKAKDFGRWIKKHAP
jgi:hypothetical protein